MSKNNRKEKSRIKNFLSKIRVDRLLLISILLLGFYLRVHDLNTWPRKGATFDEYAWTWVGISLIQNHVPISWSPHPQYKDSKDIIYQKTHFRIVKPFLEHPPVFGLLVGAFALSQGVKDMYHLDISHIRGLALILGVLSIYLIYLLTSELYSRKTGLLASFIYSVVPTIAVGSKIVQNENFFIPVWLLSLYFLSRYIQVKKKRYRNIAILLCSVLILAKIPWIAGSLSLIGILIFFKKGKDALYAIGGIAFAFLIFAMYGYLYDWNLFLNLWKLQSARYDITFDSIFAIFQKPYLVDRFYTDGWIYFGWISMFVLFTKDLKKQIFVIIPFLAYFLIFLAGVPDEPGHGWYRYPFYPFFVISISLFLQEYFLKNFTMTFMFFVVVGTSLLQLTWEKAFGFSFLLFRVAIISWLFILSPYFSLFKPKVKFVKVLGYSWIVAVFLMSIWAVLIYNEQ